MWARDRTYGIQNVQWHRFDLHDVAVMDFSEQESARFDLRPGDLLVCEGGEVGRCATWTGQLAEMHFQKALHRVRPAPGVHVKYLEYWLRWSADTGRFEGFTTRQYHRPSTATRPPPAPVTTRA